MSWAAILLALSLIVGPGPARVQARAGVAARARVRRAVPDTAADDPLLVASTLDMLAACLRAGLAVATAAAATAAAAPPPLARVLTRGADLLTLGADAERAWAPGAGVDRHTDALLRLARRSASSGSALADGVAELAARVRRDAADHAAATAERAGVLIAGPLGLCYLPAFVCLGIVPVVAGLAGDVLRSGVL